MSTEKSEVAPVPKGQGRAEEEEESKTTVTESVNEIFDHFDFSTTKETLDELIAALQNKLSVEKGGSVEVNAKRELLSNALSAISGITPPTTAPSPGQLPSVPPNVQPHIDMTVPRNVSAGGVAGAQVAGGGAQGYTPRVHVKVFNREGHTAISDPPKLEDRTKFTTYSDGILVWLFKNGLSPLMEKSRDQLIIEHVNVYPDGEQRKTATAIFNVVQEKLCGYLVGTIEHLIPSISVWLKKGQTIDNGTIVYDFHKLWKAIKEEFDKSTQYSSLGLLTKLENLAPTANEDPSHFYRKWEEIELEIEKVTGNRPYSDDIKAVKLLAKLPPEYNTIKEMLFVQSAGQTLTSQKVMDLHKTYYEAMFSSNKVPSTTTAYYNNRWKNNKKYYNNNNSYKNKAKANKEKEREYHHYKEDNISNTIINEIPGDKTKYVFYIGQDGETVELPDDEFVSSYTLEEDDVESDKSESSAGSGNESDEEPFHTLYIENEELRGQEWIYDTGTFSHTTNSKNNAIKGTIRTIAPITLQAFSKTLKVNQMCNVQLTETIRLKDVCIVPESGVNLVSGVKLAVAGYYAEILGEEVKIRKSAYSDVILDFKLRGHVFSLFRPTKRVNELLKQSSLQKYKGSITKTRRKVIDGDEEEEEEKKESISLAPSSSSSSSSSSDILPSVSAPTVRKIPKRSASSSSSSKPSYSVSQVATEEEKLYNIHRIYGHQKLTPQILDKERIKIKLTSSNDPSTKCNICFSTHAKHSYVHGVADYPGRATEPIQTIHADTIGPITISESGIKQPCPSYDQKLYASILVAETSRFVITESVKFKSEIPPLVVNDLIWLQHQTGLEIKRFHSDGGTEFVNETVKTYCDGKGITRTQSTPYSPWHNGIAERTNGKLITIVRSLFAECGGGPLKLWPFAFKHATIILNNSPAKSNNNLIPYEVLFGHGSKLQKLGIFGTDAYALIESPFQTKLQPTAEIVIYLGYDNKQNGSIVLNPFTYRFRTTRNIKKLNTFHVAKYLRNEITKSDLLQILSPTIDFPPMAENEQKLELEQPIVPQPQQPPIVEEEEQDVEEFYEVDKILNKKYENGKDYYLVKFTGYDKPEWIEKSLMDIDAPLVVKEYEDSVLQKENIDLERKHEVSPLPSPISEPLPEIPSPPIVVSPEVELPPSTQQIPRRSTRTRRAPITFQPSFAVSSKIFEPQTYQQAITCDDKEFWIEAMDEEYNGLLAFNVFDVVPRKPDMVVLGSKWVYKVKYDSDGELERYKCRLVIKGYDQEFGIHYIDTFAPVVRSTSLKLVLLIITIYKLESEQFDVKQAFIHADADVQMYCELPSGYKVPGDNVWLLNTSIYGSKQAPRLFYELMNHILISLNYDNLYCDTCVYSKFIPGHEIPIILTVYVDDVVIAYPPKLKSVWKNDFAKIQQQLLVKELGKPEFILKMKITNLSDGSLHLLNNTHIKDIIKSAGLEECKISKNPCLSDATITSTDINTLSPLDETEHKLYRSITGKLSYITGMTRPDIALPTFLLSIKLQSPSKKDFTLLKHVVRYLAGTPNYGLKLVNQPSPGEEITVTIYTDATWASDKLDGKSITGMILFVNGTPIEWMSKKQPTVALSSAEAEFMALTPGCQLGLWIRSWFKLVLHKDVIPTIVTDNQAARSLANDPKDHRRTKHIAIRYFFIRDHTLRNHIKVKWITGEEQIADGLTKPLSTAKFVSFRDLVVHPLKEK